MNIIDAINNSVTSIIQVEPYELHIFEERNNIESIPVDFKIINNKQPLTPTDVLFIHKTKTNNDKILIDRLLINKYYPIGSTIVFENRSMIVVDYGDIKVYGGKAYAHILVKDVSSSNIVEHLDTTHTERKVIESLNNMIMEDSRIANLLPYYNKYNWMNYVSDTEDGIETSEAYKTLLEIYEMEKKFHNIIYGDIYTDSSYKIEFEKMFINCNYVDIRLGKASLKVSTISFVLWLLDKYLKTDNYNDTKDLLDNLKIINILSKPYGIFIDKSIDNTNNVCIDILINTTDDCKDNYLIRLTNVNYVTLGELFDITAENCRLFRIIEKAYENGLIETNLASTVDDSYMDPELEAAITNDGKATLSATDGEYSAQIINGQVVINRNDENSTMKSSSITTDFSDSTYNFVNIDLKESKYVTKIIISGITDPSTLYLSYKQGGEEKFELPFELIVNENMVTLVFEPIYCNYITISTTHDSIKTSEVVCYGYNNLEEITNVKYSDYIDMIVKSLEIILGITDSTNYPYNIHNLLIDNISTSV